MARRGRRQRAGRRQVLCTSEGIRCTQSLSRPVRRSGTCQHQSPKPEQSTIDLIGHLPDTEKIEHCCGVPQQTPVLSRSCEVEKDLDCGEPDRKDRIEERVDEHENNENAVDVAEEADVKERIEKTADEDVEGEEDAEEEEEEEDEDDEDEDAKAKEAMFERMSCPRRRRMALNQWVHRRVKEMGCEDSDEPDSEDEAIRCALMDAMGAATENVEMDLSGDALNLLAYASDCQPIDVPPVPKVNFADSTLTYVIKPETETTIALVSTTCNTCWTLDSVIETSLFDTPSAPIGKWREKPSKAEGVKSGAQNA